MVGSPQVLVCSVKTVDGVESNLVTISWIGPEGSYTNNSRVTIEMDRGEWQMSETPLYSNIYNSSLQFAYLMEGDEGIYNCSVTILDTANSQSVAMESLSSKQTIVLIKHFTIQFFYMQNSTYINTYF